MVVVVSPVGVVVVIVGIELDTTTANADDVVVWDEEGWHYQPPVHLFSSEQNIRKERIALYILALDAINFCFWPSNDYEYEYVDLATTLTSIASSDHNERQSRFVIQLQRQFLSVFETQRYV